MVAVHLAQFFAQVGFERFQEFNVSLWIKTADARPVAGEADFGSTAGREQHQADVDEFVFDRVGRVAQDKETTILLLRHHCTFHSVAPLQTANVYRQLGIRLLLHQAAQRARAGFTASVTSRLLLPAWLRLPSPTLERAGGMSCETR